MNKNKLSPYIRTAMFSTLKKSFYINDRVLFDTDINSLAIYTPYYYTSKEDGQQKFHSPCLINAIKLKDTTEWQYVSGVVAADLTHFMNDSGSTPKQWSFTITVWNADEGAETEIWIDKVHFAPSDLN